MSQSEIEAIQSSSARDFTNVDVSETGTSSLQKQPPMVDHKADVTAYIDQESRLPVALVIEAPTGKTTTTYQFDKEAHPAPSRADGHDVKKANNQPAEKAKGDLR